MQYTDRSVYEYISTINNDPIIERKTCALSGQQFAIYQSDIDFYTRMSPTFAWKVWNIPTPTLCPEERKRRRLSFRNERKLYRRQCDASKQSIISIYSPDKPHKVYEHKIRRSDHWDAMDYWRSFDFSKTFTENFQQLLIDVPLMNLYVTPDADENNCHYVNAAWFNTNCYFIFDSDQNSNSLYSTWLKNSMHCIDTLYSMNCEYCYELIYCVWCYKSNFCIFCTHCTDCVWCRSCLWCTDCIWCYWLKNKQYCIFNKQYSKEEYQQKYTQMEHIWYINYWNNMILPATHNMIQTCEQVFWSSLAYCKNVQQCFDCSWIQESKYCDGIMNWTEYLYDHSSFWENASYTIECEWTWRRVHNIQFCQNIFLDTRDIYYSRSCCQWSHNLFWCIGLRNKSYCIFNKQYSVYEYETYTAKIIAHMQETWEWWEFFHPSLSPFWYNETVAQEHYPLTQSETSIQDNKTMIDYTQFWYHWSDYNADPTIPEDTHTIHRSHYSHQERQDLLTQDTLETQIFICSISWRPYRLQKAEITFYRQFMLPIPDKHPDIRHQERLTRKPWDTLYIRHCDDTNKTIVSVYPPWYSQKVYSEESYLKSVLW